MTRSTDPSPGQIWSWIKDPIRVPRTDLSFTRFTIGENDPIVIVSRWPRFGGCLWCVLVKGTHCLIDGDHFANGFLKRWDAGDV